MVPPVTADLPPLAQMPVLLPVCLPHAKITSVDTQAKPKCLSAVSLVNQPVLHQAAPEERFLLLGKSWISI